MKLLTSLSLAAVALLGTNALAQSPCSLGDDGFNIGCCDTPNPNLPDFQDIVEEGVYACYQNCGLEKAFKVKVVVAAPEFFGCDQAIIKMEVIPQTVGAPTISGRMIAKYSRTWRSTFGGGTQVWRFLLNGDWDYGPSISTQGCPVPPAPNPSHVIGSIDYACDPTTGFAIPRIALNLSHLPGCISHGPMSARPLVGAAAHTDRSYHLVAPRNNFSFGPSSDIQGTLKNEAVRSSPTGTCFPQTYKCLTEVPVIDGKIGTVFKNCVCTPSFVAPWTHSEMKGVVECNGASTSFATVDNFDPAVPTGLTGLGLGRWSGPSWPGDQELTVFFGYIRYADICQGFASLDPHRVFGVATSGEPGYLFSPTPVLQPYKTFLDLQDNLIPNTINPIPWPGPLPAPCIGLSKGFGAPAYSSLVWNLNPTP